MNEFGDGFWIGYISGLAGVCLIELFARWWKKVGDRRLAEKPRQEISNE